MILFLWRVGIDFLREGTPFFLGLHQAQVVAIIVLAIIISWLAWRTRWVKRLPVSTGVAVADLELENSSEEGIQKGDASK